jgi:hypothetical protein
LLTIWDAELRTTISTTVTIRHLVKEGAFSINREATVNMAEVQKRIVRNVANPAPKFDSPRPSTRVPQA